MSRQPEGKSAPISVRVLALGDPRDGLWDQGNREQSVVVLANAHVHHLCLWFLLYGGD